MSRFFVPPENIGESEIVIDDRDDLRHMVKVLRLSEGDEIDISDAREWEYRARLNHLDAGEARAKILDKQKCTTEPETKVTLFQGIPKQGKMETIIQKCVELGVFRIVPVFMARTVVVDKGNFGRKLQRWQKVSDEAVKQCRRGMMPEVAEPLKTAEATERFDDFDLVLFPYENEDGTTIKDVLRGAAKSGKAMLRSGAGDGAAYAADGNTDGCGNTAEDSSTAADGGNFAEDGNSVADGIQAKPRRIALIIGPEGGFSDEEARQIIAAGGKSVSLGKTTLRTETAGMAALAMLMYELEL